MLSMAALLKSQNGAVLAANYLWQSDCAHQSEGLKEKIIFYRITDSEAGQLPQLACKMCLQEISQNLPEQMDPRLLSV